MPRSKFGRKPKFRKRWARFGRKPLPPASRDSEFIRYHRAKYHSLYPDRFLPWSVVRKSRLSLSSKAYSDSIKPEVTKLGNQLSALAEEFDIFSQLVEF